MVRPTRQTQFVYRVQVKRPRSKDSVVRWVTITPERIKARYGDAVLSIQRFRFDGVVKKSSGGAQ